MNETLQLVLLLAIIIILAKLAGAASGKIGQPAVFGELLIGLLLGPTALNILHWEIFSAESLEHVILEMAELGVIFLMFLAGMETDLGKMKQVGLAALNGAVGGVILPFGAGIGLSRLFGYGWTESVFIGTILTATSVSITAQTLMELGQLRSKEGTTILGAAVIDDILGIIVLSLVIAFSTQPSTGGSAESTSTVMVFVTLIAKMALYFGAAILLGKLLFERVAGWFSNLHASEPLAAYVFAVILVYSWGAEYLGGVAAITGAYVAGVMFAQTRFRHEIEEKIKVVTYSLFVPIFFISIGLQANARTLGADFEFLIWIILAAILAKLLGAGLGTMITGFKVIEGVRVGTGMISRGEVALIVASIGLSAGIIQEDIFSIMVLMTLVTTLITPILLRFLFPRGSEEKAVVAEVE